MTAETRFLKRQPPPNLQTKGGLGAGSGAVMLDLGNAVWKLSAPGTPVDGTSGTGAGWAGPGSEYTDVTAGELYIQHGTKASPAWKLVTHA